MTSPFSVLYIVVIIIASALVGRTAGYLIATASWVLYALVILAIHYQWVAQPTIMKSDFTSVARLIYSLGIHIFGFYAVVYLTSQLTAHLEQAESELAANRADLADLKEIHRDVIHSIPSGLLTTDLEHRITSVNQAGEEILKRTGEELWGTPVSRIGFQPFGAHQPRDDDGSRQTMANRHELQYQVDGEVRAIGYSITNLTNAQGAPLGHIVIFQDLTEWRQLQDDLQLKDRMAAVGEMAAGLAHEIGNPLAAIYGSVQMMAVDLEEDSPQHRLLEITRRESERLDRTIKGFLRFARPKERSNAHFDIADLLRENFELLKNSPEVSPHHEVTIDLQPESADLLADPDQISQIFWNLARNSIRAMPDGGILKVTGTLSTKTYRIVVSDTGHGMTQKERDQIFQPFKSTFAGGTGIGMAIVYRIVQEHGGHMSVESRPGEGTTIAIELPTNPISGRPTPPEVST